MPKNLTTWIGLAILFGVPAGLLSATQPDLSWLFSWTHIFGEVFVADNRGRVAMQPGLEALDERGDGAVLSRFAAIQ